MTIILGVINHLVITQLGNTSNCYSRAVIFITSGPATIVIRAITVKPSKLLEDYQSSVASLAEQSAAP